MAGFFDKVVEGLNKGVSTVSEGSKYIVEKANINNQIKDAERDKTAMMQNLGTLVYNLHINGEIEIPQCLGMCGEAAAIDKRIAELHQNLQTLEAAKNQPTYASSQQYAQPQYTQPQQQYAQPQPAEGGVTCECGFVNKSAAKFCSKCGKPLAANAAE